MDVPFHLGDWTAVPQANELVRGGRAERVEPKVMEVLCLLAAHAGAVVRREDLFEHVWPEVLVSEDTLNGTISKLRRALGDDPRAPRYVETIPRVGYRLLVTPVPAGADAAAVAAPATDEMQDGPPEPVSPSNRSSAAMIGVVVAFVVLMAAVAWWSSRTTMPAPTVRPVTSAPGVEQQPALSTDGTHVAYAARGRNVPDFDIYVADVEGEVARRLTEGPDDDLHPTWSPDGTDVAFLRCDRGDCTIFSVPLLGGPARRMAALPVSTYGLSWSPRDGRLAVSRRDTADAPFYVALIDPSSGGVTRLTQPPPTSAGDFAPAFSPGGRSVAFVRHGTGGQEDLFVMDVAGGVPRRLAGGEGAIRGFAWAPAAGSLIFSAVRDGLPALWRVPVAGGTPVRVTGLTLRDPAGVAAARRRLVVAERTMEVNLWQMQHSGAGWTVPSAVITSTGIDAAPALSPEGRYVAFVSDRTGHAELWRARRDGTDAVRLTDFGSGGLGAPAWSPDGRDVAFELQQKGRADIYVVAADGGRPLRLTQGDGYAIAPRWSPDGASIYFGSNADGTWRVWRMPATGGRATPVGPIDSFVGALAPDGGTFYYSRRSRAGLWRRPADDGEAQLLVDDLQPRDWGNWVVTTAGLFYVARTDSIARVKHFDPQRGTTVDLGIFPNLPAREQSLTATRDGHVIVFSYIDRMESDLVLVSPVR